MTTLFVDQKTIAQILQISDRRVRQLEKEGILVKHETEGLYYIPDCAQRFYEYKLKPAANADLDAEKALHEKAKREMAEIKLAQLRHEMHAAEDIEQVMTDMVITFRNRILGIPSKVAPLVIGLRNIGEIEDIIDEEIRNALTSLVDYDPCMFGGEDIAEDDKVIPEDSTSSSTSAKDNG